MGKKKGKKAAGDAPTSEESASSSGIPSQQKQDCPPQSPQQQQQQQQPQGPQFQRQPQQHGAWLRGPPPQQQQPQGPQFQRQPQQHGAWQRGPPPQQQPQGPQFQPQPQQHGAWQRGPPPQQQPQGPQFQPQPQQHGAWQRGPPPRQQPQGPQFQPQPQQHGAWQRGPPPQQQQPQGPQLQPQPQQHGAWPRGPPPQQLQPQGPQLQRQPQQHGAWPRGPPPQQQQPQGPQLQPQPQQSDPEETIKTHHQKQIHDPPSPQGTAGIPPSKKKKEKPSSREQKQPSGELQSSVEFAPRITATRKQGKVITVATNFFPLYITNPNITVYHYNVVIDPDKPKHLIRAVWNKFISIVAPGSKTAFDGKNGYSKNPLPNNTRVTTVTVINPENNKEKEFKVSVEEVRKVSLACFDNYREKMLQSKSQKVLPEAELAILDIILNNWACDNLVRSGKTFFPLSTTLPSKISLSDKLSLRFGYYQSAVLGFKPYLNFDISHKAFYKECSVLDIVECFRNRFTKELDIDEMNHFFRTVKVEYQLPGNPESKRAFRINKLVANANQQTFTKEDGSKITVSDYFAKEKKCRLKRPDLPLFWVGPTQKSIYVPMEFCTIARDQVYKGLMDSYETREMVKKATSNARDRKRHTYEVFDKTKINDHPLMEEFGLKVGNDMERVCARILDPPTLRTSRSVRVREGVWRIQDFSEPVTVEKWCILVLDRRVSKQNVMNLQRLLQSKGKELNMKISDPAKNPIESETSFPALKKAFSQLKDMKIVFVIISDQKAVYSRVKAICETQEGILTQCIKSGTVGQDPRKLSTTVENILLKVNAKLGGKNTILDRNSVPPCLKGKVMVIGADVTHPSPGLKIPSVAAVAVSYDPETFQYSATMRPQPKGEMIKDMEEIVSIHLKKFNEVRKSYPEKIIFFRDGVSEGELPKVYNTELAAVRNACRGLCQPKITFVVVQKRHHTRFYPTSEADEQGKNYNVPVGTCVDTDIVHPRDMDFYLLSHNSILGTARPTRYRLLHDDNKLTDDEVETLTFYLCHLYSRCNRSVSYPSPTYNAHLAAARVRAYLEGLNLLGRDDVENINKQLLDNISKFSPMYFV